MIKSFFKPPYLLYLKEQESNLLGWVAFLFARKELQGMQKMTEKQKRFCDYYIQSANATEAAIKAGYSKKTAGVIGDENLKKPYIKNYIDQQLKKMADDRIADATEVMEYLTSVMRGESSSEVAMPTGIGIEKVKKTPDEKERTKAAELIGKRYGIFSEKVDLNIIDTTWFKEDDDEETS